MPSFRPGHYLFGDLYKKAPDGCSLSAGATTKRLRGQHETRQLHLDTTASTLIPEALIRARRKVNVTIRLHRMPFIGHFSVET